MNKTHIFIGIIGAALVVAAIGNAFSSEEYYRDTHVRWDHDGSSGSEASIDFDGKDVKCDAETGSVVLEHEDGSTTTVICD